MKIDRYLFRGKRIDTGEWGESMTISKGVTKSKSDCMFLEISEGHWPEIIPESVGQFIGLLDKNGKKIFEGDIVKCKSPNDGRIFITPIEADLICGIIFLNRDLNRDLIVYGNSFPDEIEIIGNIHDTPKSK